MFTGLVADVGTVRGLERPPGGVRLHIASPLAGELAPGDSVAVAGVCLTAVETGPDRFAVDVMEETLARCSLGALDEGGPVNLELPLRAGDRLGGHVVQGHVDGLGTVEDVTGDGFARRLALRADPAICRYLAEKGSVALDGVSLTVVSAADDGFAVALIPETLERTTLGTLIVGDSVNIEVDVLAKYVDRLLEAGARPPGAVEVSR